MHKDFKTNKWKIELKKLPKLEDLKQILRVFADTDFSNQPLDKIEEAYFKNINIFPGHSTLIPNKTINLLKLYRVRNNLNLDKENIQLASTFSYPPATFCSANGRANTSKSPVFYCSDNIKTSFFEVRPTPNELMFISFWSIKCDRKVNFIPILADNLTNKNIWKSTADKMYKSLIEQTQESGQDKSNELLLLYKVFSYWFATEIEPYYKTSWIANRYLYKTNGIDFIIYPSFINDRDTCSMAFHPNFVDNYLRLDKVISYKIYEKPNNKYEIEITGVGIPSLTNINWSAPSPDDPDVKRLRIK